MSTYIDVLKKQEDQISSLQIDADRDIGKTIKTGLRGFQAEELFEKTMREGIHKYGIGFLDKNTKAIEVAERFGLDVSSSDVKCFLVALALEIR